MDPAAESSDTAELSLVPTYLYAHVVRYSKCLISPRLSVELHGLSVGRHSTLLVDPAAESSDESIDAT